MKEARWTGLQRVVRSTRRAQLVAVRRASRVRRKLYVRAQYDGASGANPSWDISAPNGLSEQEEVLTLKRSGQPGRLPRDAARQRLVLLDVSGSSSTNRGRRPPRARERDAPKAVVRLACAKQAVNAGTPDLQAREPRHGGGHAKSPRPLPSDNRNAVELAQPRSGQDSQGHGGGANSGLDSNSANDQARVVLAIRRSLEAGMFATLDFGRPLDCDRGSSEYVFKPVTHRSDRREEGGNFVRFGVETGGTAANDRDTSGPCGEKSSPPASLSSTKQARRTERLERYGAGKQSRAAATGEHTAAARD